MSPRNLSIDCFFPPVASNASALTLPSLVPNEGDGFTAEEVDAVLNPKINTLWTPERDYEERDIGYLDAGPHCIQVRGRIVNFSDQARTVKRPKAAKGCVKMIIKDNTGALVVRLWYANMEYNLRLGQLVSIWTPHISNGERGALAVAQAPLFTSIFPERDRSCHFMITENDNQGVEFKSPLGYREGEALSELMTLKSFMDGGCEVSNARILVCVKGVGVKKKITTKRGEANDLVKVIVFDDTGEATLSLWKSMVDSAQSWAALCTVLLITSPGWRIDKNLWLSVTSNTMLDVDPMISDAFWLRGYAQRMIKREHINPPFPNDAFDFIGFANSKSKALFTFAELDELSRLAPTDHITGCLSVILLELNIEKYYRRGMLFSNECCGLPLFANAISAKCKHCDKHIELQINPRILGMLLDETGCTEVGKLVLSPKAWHQLLHVTKEKLAETTPEEQSYIEQRLLFARLTLIFGWYSEQGDGVGRLYVWEIHI